MVNKYVQPERGMKKMCENKYIERMQMSKIIYLNHLS